MENSESFEITQVPAPKIEVGDEITFEPGYDLMSRFGTVTAKKFERNEWRDMVVTFTVDSGGDEFTLTFAYEGDRVERIVR